MPAPAIFGVEGREVGPYCVEWSVGPLQARAQAFFVATDNESQEAAYRRRPNVWRGKWVAARPEHRPLLYCSDQGSFESVVEGLESWLRVHVAELVGALGLELVERKLAHDVEECDREFRETRNRIRRGRREPRGSKGFRP